MTFKELMHKILDRIKHEPYLRWSSKMGGDPTRRNQNLNCTYHRDKGHTTKQCRVLKDHLEQLVRLGLLKKFVDLGGQGTEQTSRPRGNPFPPPLGIIEVIHAALMGTQVTRRKGVLTVVPAESPQEE